MNNFIKYFSLFFFITFLLSCKKDTDIKEVIEPPTGVSLRFCNRDINNTFTGYQEVFYNTYPKRLNYNYNSLGNEISLNKFSLYIQTYPANYRKWLDHNIINTTAVDYQLYLKQGYDIKYFIKNDDSVVINNILQYFKKLAEESGCNLDDIVNNEGTVHIYEYRDIPLININITATTDILGIKAGESLNDLFCIYKLDPDYMIDILISSITKEVIKTHSFRNLPETIDELVALNVMTPPTIMLAFNNKTIEEFKKTSNQNLSIKTSFKAEIVVKQNDTTKTFVSYAKPITIKI